MYVTISEEIEGFMPKVYFYVLIMAINQPVYIYDVNQLQKHFNSVCL